jgi:hypothetical protein
MLWIGFSLKWVPSNFLDRGATWFLAKTYPDIRSSRNLSEFLLTDVNVLRHPLLAEGFTDQFIITVRSKAFLL